MRRQFRVPELTTDAITGTLARGVLDGRSPDERQVGWNTSNVLPGPELDVLRLERMELESQIPDLRRECVELRGKLAGLKREIRAAQEDRDVLFAAAAAHRKYVAELSREQPEQDQEELPRCAANSRCSGRGTPSSRDRGPIRYPHQDFPTPFLERQAAVRRLMNETEGPPPS